MFACSATHAPAFASNGLRRPEAAARRSARLSVRAQAINPSIKKDVEKVVDFIKADEIKGKVGPWHAPFSAGC